MNAGSIVSGNTALSASSGALRSWFLKPTNSMLTNLCSLSTSLEANYREKYLISHPVSCCCNYSYLSVVYSLRHYKAF